MKHVEYEFCDRVSPQWVVAMEAADKLPPDVRRLWQETSGVDPVADAKRCLKNRRWIILCGVISCFLSIACLILLLWFNREVSWFTGAPYHILPSDRVNGAISIFGAMILAFASLCFCIGAGTPGKRFTSIEGCFGHDFAQLMVLLEKRPDRLVLLNEDALRGMVTEALVQQARKVMGVERNCFEDFRAGDPISYWETHEPLRQRERNEFARMYTVFKPFGLTDPSGWGSYFVEAKRRDA